MKKYFILALILIFSGSIIVAAEFHVGSSQPYTTIQSAIDIATNGDIITVHEGEYVENLNIYNKSVTIRNSNWDTGNWHPEDFVIDGNSNNGHDVIKINNCVAFTIQGFSIINSGVWSDDWGIDAYYTNNLEISNCIFDNNQFAIDVQNCSNVIIDSNISYYDNILSEGIIKCDLLSEFTISNNTFFGILGGTCILLTRTANGKISHNSFHEFQTVIDLGWRNSGNEDIIINNNEFNFSLGISNSNSSIYVNSADNLTITENTFNYNPQDDSGIAIQVWGNSNAIGYIMIKGNIFFNNYKSIELWSDENYATVDVVNNTFIGYNGVTNHDNIIAIRGYYNQLNLFKNNIIYSALDDFYVDESIIFTHITPTISYNSLGEDILDQYPDWNGEENVIGVNPQLSIDYHLTENSTDCIDEGDPDTDGDEDDWLIDEDDRDIDGSRKDMGCYPYLHDYDTKHFEPGWQWVSFPVIELDSELVYQGSHVSLVDQMYEQVYEENGYNGLLQDPDTGDLTINGFKTIKCKRDIEMGIYYFNNEFNDNEGFANMLFRHEGYKIEVDDNASQTTLVVGEEESAERLPANHEIVGTMTPGEYHWLGFWIPRTQSMIESFGPFWQNIEKVKSEDWLYAPKNSQRGGDPNYPTVLIADNLTLEYGKTYLVQFNENENVEDFYWTDTGQPTEKKEKARPVVFEFEEKADYEAIDVLNIPSSVTEIGVFEDGICKGAVVVEDTCAQILVYSDNANREPIPFTFEFATGRGLSTPVKNYQVYNILTGKYEKKSVFSGYQEYSIVRFGDSDEPEDNTPTAPKLHGNYPNPFNPTTTISFSLPEEQKMNLTVYNIKGQKVKQLTSGKLPAGEHSIVWDGKDTNGKSVSTGIYFYKLKAGKKEISKKMLLLK